MRLLVFYVSFWTLIFSSSTVLALPPENDLPEEILSTEIILEGRSNLDNEPLTVSEYILQAQKEDNSIFPPDVDSKLKHQIFLLKILKMLKTFSPI